VNIPEPPFPLVLVIWEDIRTRDEKGGAWTEYKDVTYDPHLVCSVGWIVKEFPEGIHLTFAWHPELMAPPDQIPRAVIRSITPLGPIKPLRKRSRT